MKILIADSGSTKTDWRLITDYGIKQYNTVGLNPVYKNNKELLDIITNLSQKMDYPTQEIGAIYFYGAGCMHFEKADVIYSVLNKVFNHAEIHVSSDILAAARATCIHSRGIVAILGTGANVCLYNGNEIEYTRSGLGFILGDEGSGAHIGKEFIKAILNDELPKELVERFYAKFNLSKAEVINSIYREQEPNIFLAQFSKYVFQLKDKYPRIEEVIIHCFREFFEKHILAINNYQLYEINIVGSVGFYFSNYLRKLAPQYNIKIGAVIEKPIAGLTLFHQEGLLS